jgi:hypothetical protein
VFRFRRRLIAWVLLAIGIPLLAEGLHRVADALEARRGPSPTTSGLRWAGQVADGVRQRRRGLR